MKEFNNVSMKPSNVTLFLKDELVTNYEIYGFAFEKMEDGIKCVELQPADLRYNPVMRVPISRVAKVTCKF